MLLYIVRHADPIYNPDTLTPRGRLQAAALAKRLAGAGIDKIYSSPLGRAMETAKPTADLLGLEIGIEEWTSEAEIIRDFVIARADGQRFCTFDVQNTRIRNNETPPPGGEWYDIPGFKGANAKAGVERVIRESDAFLARLSYVRAGAVYKILSPSDERVCVFCHHGFGATWLSHLLGIAPNVFWASFDIAHSGVTILEFRNNEDGQTAPRCLCLSDLSHIYGEGLPMKYSNETDI